MDLRAVTSQLMTVRGIDASHTKIRWVGRPSGLGLREDARLKKERCAFNRGPSPLGDSSTVPDAVMRGGVDRDMHGWAGAPHRSIA